MAQRKQMLSSAEDMLASAAVDAMALNISSPSEALAQVLLLLLQQNRYKDLREAATVARLLCVSKQLQRSLETAAVGCIDVTLTLSTSQVFDSRFIRQSPEYEAPLSAGKLAWLSAQVQKGNIGQLRLTGVSAISTNHHRQELIAVLPALEELWTDLCSRYSACFHCCSGTYGLHTPWPEVYSSCDVVIDVKPHNTPPNPAHCSPELSYTITTITLGIEHPNVSHNHASDFTEVRSMWQPALQQLPQLTSLLELNLPVFNPPEGVLAPALSALTNLTKLFIHHPLTPVQQALPVSLKHLTVARQYRFHDWDDPPRLPALQLSHLTALKTLVIFESHWSRHSPDMWNNLGMACEGVPAESVLPVSLQHVEVKGLRYAQPLLAMTQLKTLTITHGIISLRSHVEPECEAADTNVLLALTKLTSLTRVIIKGRRPTKAEVQKDGLQAAFDALPVDLWGLDPAVDNHDSSAEASDSVLGLLGMGVRGSRMCSLWAGVRALVEAIGIAEAWLSR